MAFRSKAGRSFTGDNFRIWEQIEHGVCEEECKAKDNRVTGVSVHNINLFLRSFAAHFENICANPEYSVSDIPKL